MLIVNLENDTIDLAQMIACRNPRLALDRDDVGFSHAGDCNNEDQLNYEEIEGCLIFTLNHKPDRTTSASYQSFAFHWTIVQCFHS